ncbi:MAG: acyltransferase [Paraburkholderia tropica]|uniref:acyltransferase family protein n=1 Tax=Burkholderia gladioli TaxID=28095 RepID=UPI0005102895|nr:acyltransferase [Burkholderia gladioli]AYQ89954.1 acyltransferase [Burkholderia gladioli]KGE11683.1 acyltransferase [Burkholderia gladioli]
MSSASTSEMDIGAVYQDLGALEIDRPARAPTRPKLPSLTGSRFWAAFLVFLFHSSLPSDLAPFADPAAQHVFATIVSKAGWLGVSYFFILSGFIMVWSAKDNDTVGDFYLRRFAKIYPTHCLTWAIAFVVGAVGVGEYKLWSSSLLLVNTWVDDVKFFFVANRPSWSLCIEAFFYLLFPLLFKAMKAIPRTFDLAGLVLVTFASLLVQTYIYFQVEPNHMMGAFQISQRQFWVSYIFPPPRLFEFLAGMFAARLLMHGRAPLLPKSAALALLLATYVGAMFIPFQFSMSVVYIIPVSLLIVSIARDDLETRKTFLSAKTSVWLGEISYAFYMIHFLVLFFFLNLVSGKKFGLPEGTALIAVALILSVSCASFVYRYFEVPMMRRILDHFRSRGLKTLSQ